MSSWYFPPFSGRVSWWANSAIKLDISSARGPAPPGGPLFLGMALSERCRTMPRCAPDSPPGHPPYVWPDTYCRSSAFYSTDSSPAYQFGHFHKWAGFFRQHPVCTVRPPRRESANQTGQNRCKCARVNPGSAQCAPTRRRCTLRHPASRWQLLVRPV